MRASREIIHWLGVLWLATLAGACKVAPHKKASDSFQADPLAATAIDLTGSLQLTRLSPEQLAAHLKTALGFNPVYDDGDGNTRNLITDDYAVALGGVDFDGAFKRDPVAKVTTLLICRSLAWQAARKVVYDETEGKNQPPLFSKSDVQKDRPYMEADNDLTGQARIDLQAGESRWQDQVSEFYWRLFSRPPTADEMALVKATFMQAYTNEQDTVKSWVLVLYSLLSTAEFWNA